MGGTIAWALTLALIKEGLRPAEDIWRKEISERHRHRYEFNNEYLADFEKAGLKAAGVHPEAGLVEIIELKDHPWFIGVQFHPEYKSHR